MGRRGAAGGASAGSPVSGWDGQEPAPQQPARPARKSQQRWNQSTAVGNQSGRAAAPARGSQEYQHVQGKLHGYLAGDEPPPTARSRRKRGASRSPRRGGGRSGSGGGGGGRAAARRGGLSAAQLQQRISALREELSMGKAALAQYLEANGRSAEYDSFSQEVERLAQKLAQMEAARAEAEAEEAEVPPPSSGPSVTLSVDCPPRTAPGQTILVATEWGEELAVAIPAGVRPGQPFLLTVEAPPALAQRSPEIVAATTHEPEPERATCVCDPHPPTLSAILCAQADGCAASLRGGPQKASRGVGGASARGYAHRRQQPEEPAEAAAAAAAAAAPARDNRTEVTLSPTFWAAVQNSMAVRSVCRAALLTDTVLVLAQHPGAAGSGRGRGSL